MDFQAANSSVEMKRSKSRKKVYFPKAFLKTQHHTRPCLDVRMKIFSKRTLLKYRARKDGLKNSRNSKVRNGKRIYKKVKPYKCPTCCKGFIFSNNLKRHNRLFHQNYSDLVKDSKHINTDRSNQIIGHNSKNKEYNNAIEENTDLVNHMKIHWGDKPYECITCGLRFHFKSGIRRHMSVHTKEKPFSCSMCNNTFTRSSSLYKHMRRIHQEDFTVSPSGLQDQHVDKNNKRISPLDDDLAKQSKLHIGDLKPFECITCHKRFYEKTELRRHLRVHSGEKPYPCNYCEKTFGSSGNLYSHLRRIHYELCKDLYNFKPPPSSSVQRFNSDNYNKLPSNSIPSSSTPSLPQSLSIDQDKCFKCTVCHERFSSEIELLLHAKNHQRAQENKCYFCDQVFSHLGHMHVHMRLLHNYATNEAFGFNISEVENNSYSSNDFNEFRYING